MVVMIQIGVPTDIVEAIKFAKILVTSFHVGKLGRLIDLIDGTVTRCHHPGDAREGQSNLRVHTCYLLQLNVSRSRCQLRESV